MVFLIEEGCDILEFKYDEKKYVKIYLIVLFLKRKKRDEYIYICIIYRFFLEEE